MDQKACGSNEGLKDERLEVNTYVIIIASVVVKCLGPNLELGDLRHVSARALRDTSLSF